MHLLGEFLEFSESTVPNSVKLSKFGLVDFLNRSPLPLSELYLFLLLLPHVFPHKQALPGAQPQDLLLDDVGLHILPGSLAIFLLFVQAVPSLRELGTVMLRRGPNTPFPASGGLYLMPTFNNLLL